MGRAHFDCNEHLHYFTRLMMKMKMFPWRCFQKHFCFECWINGLLQGVKDSKRPTRGCPEGLWFQPVTHSDRQRWCHRLMTGTEKGEPKNTNVYAWYQLVKWEHDPVENRIWTVESASKLDQLTNPSLVDLRSRHKVTVIFSNVFIGNGTVFWRSSEGSRHSHSRHWIWT